MSSITMILGSNAAAVRASVVQAGVNAALADYLSLPVSSHKAAAENIQAQTADDSESETKEARTKKSKDSTKKKTEKNSAKKSEKQTDRKPEKNTEKSTAKKTKKAKKTAQKETAAICGYKKLGIADVDNYLNIRAEASEDAKVVGKLPADAGCEVLDSKDGWHRITSGDVTGYVRSDYIVKGKKAEKLAEKLKRKVATVNTMTLYVREKPNTDCTILSIAGEDEELEVVKEGKKWIKVKLEDDKGYVSAKYADISEQLKKAEVYTEPSKSEDGSASSSDGSVDSSTSSSGASAAQTALQYVGGPYVWGGTSLTNGVDCSGFTMQIMAQYGVYLPHLASAQAGYGRSVSTSELQAGDLIFYGSAGNITHVAIYIGNGQIVHASNSRDGIKVSSAFYASPVCCRRVL